MAQVASQATEDVATARHEAAQARAAFEQEAAQVGAKQGEMGAAVLAQGQRSHASRAHPGGPEFRGNPDIRARPDRRESRENPEIREILEIPAILENRES